MVCSEMAPALSVYQERIYSSSLFFIVVSFLMFRLFIFIFLVFRLAHSSKNPRNTDSHFVPSEIYKSLANTVSGPFPKWTLKLRMSALSKSTGSKAK